MKTSDEIVAERIEDMPESLTSLTVMADEYVRYYFKASYGGSLSSFR